LPNAAADLLQRIPNIVARDGFYRAEETPRWVPHDLLLGVRVPANDAAWAIHRAMKQAEIDIVAEGGTPPTIDEFQKAIHEVERSRKT